jgi:hypothetical protein
VVEIPSLWHGGRESPRPAEICGGTNGVGVVSFWVDGTRVFLDGDLLRGQCRARWYLAEFRKRRQVSESECAYRVNAVVRPSSE